MGRGRGPRRSKFEEIADVSVGDHKKIVISRRAGRDQDYTISTKTLTQVDGRDIWVFLAGGVHLNGEETVHAFREAVDYLDDMIRGEYVPEDRMPDYDTVSSGEDDSWDWSPSKIL